MMRPAIAVVVGSLVLRKAVVFSSVACSWVLGGLWISDAHQSSGPGMTGIPSANTTFTAIVAPSH